MASQTFSASSGYLSSSMRLQLILSSTSNGSSANSSTLIYSLRWTKTASSDGSYNYASGNHVWLTINGQQIQNTSSWGRVNISGLGQGGYVELASGSITIPHNDDGTKSISVYARFYQSQRTDCDYVISSTFTLDNIPRYPSVTLTSTVLSPSSIKVTATVKRNGSNINCKIFNFQYCKQGASWKANDGGSGDDGLGSLSPAGYYTGKNTYTLTHTYNNLLYYQTYTFRCLVTTTDGVSINSVTKDSSGKLAAQNLTVTTAQPALMTLGECTIDPTSTGDIVFKAVSNYENTKYGMDVRIDNSAGEIFSDGTTSLTSGSTAMDISEFMKTTSAAWNNAFFPYYNSTSSGKLWIRVITYDVNGRYMGEKTYEQIVDFSSVDLNPTIEAYPNIVMRVPDGITSNMPANHTVSGSFGGAIISWNISDIVLKGGATLSYYTLNWGDTQIQLDNTTTMYMAQSNAVGDKTLELMCVDSRGNKLSMLTQSITVLEYSVPKIELAISRQGYTTTVGISGKCKISPVIVNNTHLNDKSITIQYKRSSASDDSSNWSDIPLSPTTVDDDGYFSISQTITGAFSLSEVYDVKITLSDTAGYSVQNTIVISKAVIIFGMADNGAVGVNIYPEDGYMFSVGGDSIFKGSINVSGDSHVENEYASAGYHLNAYDGTNNFPVLQSDFVGNLYLGGNDISSPQWGNIVYNGNDSHTFYNNGIIGLTVESDSITAKHSVVANLDGKSGQFYAVPSDSGKSSFIIRNDGNYTYFMFTNTDDLTGSYNDLRPLYINNSSGLVGFGNKASFGGTSYPQIFGNGSVLQLAASSSSSYGVVINGSTEFRPAGTESSNKPTLGSSSHRWGTVYSSTGSISTSDRNQKNSIQSLDEDVCLNFIKGLNPTSYKMNDGTSGRTHFGMISQDVEELLSKLNMTTLDFAGFIKSPKKQNIVNENGEIMPDEEIVEGEYTYGLRYEEFIAPIIKVVQYLLAEVNELKQTK